MLKTCMCSVALTVSLTLAASVAGAADGAAQGGALTAESIQAEALRLALKKYAPPSEGSKQARDMIAASLPDWSGVWTNAQMSTNGTFLDTATADPPHSFGLYPGERQHPPYTPEYEANHRAFMARVEAGYISDPLNYCLPAGMPRLLAGPMAYEFYIMPEMVWMVSEAYSDVRRIYTDGRGHPPLEQIVPSWSGHSVGYWDGDTLVVDTVGVRSPQIVEGIPDQVTDRSGTILSGAAQFIERMRMTGPDTIESTVVVHDPKALTRPWVLKRLWGRMPPGSFVTDVYCAEAMSAEGGERNPMVGGVPQMVLPNDPPGYVMKADQVKTDKAGKQEKKKDGTDKK